MIRGIFFKVPNEYGQLLKNILTGIDLNLFKWNFTETEIYRKDPNNKSFVSILSKNRIYSANEISQLINLDNYYTYLVNAKAFPPNGKIVPIDTYADFIKSDCQLGIFIADVIYVAVYCKDIDIIEIIKSNAIKNSYKDIEYITDDNDFRREISV